ncbi:hypothetical protein EXIGLDRAFT_326022 [Exidia glandulosa HHB12029]|uniref:Uncharacterized protein n=1 Tax=Exidia glandulosa HHB12029 TaxID=1314781 RepID=A0A165CTW6_EXIGL|nr:hypothetical protein EXIGLDRAFT_326022 [Exidia glandulosa HHB12029]
MPRTRASFPSRSPFTASCVKLGVTSARITEPSPKVRTALIVFQRLSLTYRRCRGGTTRTRTGSDTKLNTSDFRPNAVLRAGDGVAIPAGVDSSQHVCGLAVDSTRSVCGVCAQYLYRTPRPHRGSGSFARSTSVQALLF